MKSNFDHQIGSSMATALASGFMALILHLHDILHPDDKRSADSYRERLKQPMKVRQIFNNLRDPPSNGNSRDDTIIPAQRYFKPDQLMEEFWKTPSEQMPKKARVLLDKVLYNILKYVS